jgi:hypothetical protein
MGDGSTTVIEATAPIGIGTSRTWQPALGVSARKAHPKRALGMSA